MTTPAQRRRDPQPLSRGWELAAAAVGGAVIAVGLTGLAGLGLASALWGDGWVWPHGTETVIHVLGGLLHGDPGRGLPPDQLHRVAGPVPVYACVAVAELVLVATAVTSAVLISRYRRPGDARGGMATRREAQQALGLRQLRGARAIIRPDLHGRAARHRAGPDDCGTGFPQGAHRPGRRPQTSPPPKPPGQRPRHREQQPQPQSLKGVA